MRPALLRSSLAALTLASVGLPTAFAQTTERVSVDSAGVQGNQLSALPARSADGRYVAFYSAASNLVPNDTNGLTDVFLHDTLGGQTIRVSVATSGLEGDGVCTGIAVSSNGRFVAFDSSSTNLVPGDTNTCYDIFVRDLLTSTTNRVSVTSAGVEGDGASGYPSISDDGRFVAFASESTNLVPGDSNQRSDVFTHDRLTGQTIRVSVSSAGVQANEASYHAAISADGRYVAFESLASNLVPGDSNAAKDVFLYDRQTGQCSRLSVNSAGAEASGDSYDVALSSDGRFAVFESLAPDLVTGDTNAAADVFLHDRQSGVTSRVSVDSAGVQGLAASQGPALSSDGRFVVFNSHATNLVPGDTNGFSDVFLKDVFTGQISRVSESSLGAQADGPNYHSCISADGSQIGFESRATNLVGGDTNGSADIFSHDRGSPAPSLAKSGACPGAVGLTISGATANGSVAILHGPAGTFVQPTPPCQGLTLGVNPPTLGTVVSADGFGTAALNFNAPPGVCGRSVQAVDVTTCVATNVIVL